MINDGFPLNLLGFNWYQNIHNNNNPLFILGYTINIASLHHSPVPYTKVKKVKPIVKNYNNIT